MKKHFLMITAAVAGILACSLFTGCGDAAGKDSSKSGASGNFTIVTSFYPVYLSTINITNGISGVDVINMTGPQTGCLHDYQLTPDNIETLEKADVFVTNGAGMEAFLNEVAAQLPDLKVIDASAGIDLIRDSDGIDNPHVWLSIENTMKQVQNIFNGLAENDLVNAVSYKANSSVYLTKLKNLNTSAKSELSALKTKDIVTFHDAFPYFARTYGLNVVSVIEKDPDTAPTAKDLEETIRIVKKSSSKVIFTEPQYSGEAAQTVADAANARIFELDPIVTGTSDASAVNDYVIKMQKNIDTIKEALG